MLLGFLEKGPRVLMIDLSYEISVLVVFIQNPEVMFEKCFITTAGMIETTRATNVYHIYLSQMWENVQHHDDTDTLSQYHENGKFPKT